MLRLRLTGLFWCVSSVLQAMDGTEAFPEDPTPPAISPQAMDSNNKLQQVAPKEDARSDRTFAKSFDVNVKNLVSTGRNKFFILKPGFQLQYDGEKGSSQTITVLNETKLVDGVETRVVEKREFEDGKLSSVNRTYMALDKSNNNLYLFGEDIDEYEDGKLTGHEGSWTAGEDGARFGLMLSGAPETGQRYYQNQAPKKSMDRAEVISLGNKMTVPAGTFENCLKTVETTDLDSSKDVNYYAPEVGPVIDGEYKLTKYGITNAPSERALPDAIEK